MDKLSSQLSTPQSGNFTQISFFSLLDKGNKTTIYVQNLLYLYHYLRWNF